jgi:DNA replicative helicase MCM subunit Mcm2 (Cdc46/Mcm family)
MLRDLQNLMPFLAPEGGAAGAGTGTGAAGAAGAGAGAEGDTDPSQNGGAGEGAGAGKTFTQAELDRIAARARDEGRKAAEKEAAEKAAKEKMTEAERLKAEIAERDAKIKAQQEATDRRIVTAEAKLAAAAAGVHPTRVDAVIKLAADSLSQIAVDEASGEPDKKQVESAIAAILKEFPEFMGKAASGGSSSPAGFFGGGGGNQNSMDQMIRGRAGY